MKTTILALVVCVSSLACSVETWAQQSKRSPVNDWFLLLRNTRVQRELDLIESQSKDLKGLYDSMRRETRQHMQQVRNSDLGRGERRELYANLRTEVTELQQGYREKIEGVLLPDQFARLKELVVQYSARRRGLGAVGVVKDSGISEQLGVSPQQLDKLDEKANEVRKELAEKIKKLQKEAEQEILSVLTSEQRRKLRELVGETFDFGGPGLGNGAVVPMGLNLDGERGGGRRGR